MSTDPQDQLTELLTRAEEEIRRWWKPIAASIETHIENLVATAQAPALVITPHPDRFVVTANIPGATPVDLHVEILDGLVTVSGEWSDTQPLADEHTLRLVARDGGAWRRSVQLPAEQIELGEASATLGRGVLQIVIPKTDRPRARHVPILDADA